MRKRLHRFLASTRGIAAIEFAMIAPAFLATLIAILQVAIFLFAQQVLQNAAIESGRLFLTGQNQNAGTTQTQFANQICPMISALFNCNSLMVNVQSYTNFSSANATAPTLSFDSHGNVSNSWSYSPGTPGQVMVVQLVYMWPIVGGPFGYVLSNLGNNTTEMMGVSAFRIEPY